MINIVMNVIGILDDMETREIKGIEDIVFQNIRE